MKITIMPKGILVVDGKCDVIMYNDTLEYEFVRSDGEYTILWENDITCGLTNLSELQKERLYRELCKGIKRHDDGMEITYVLELKYSEELCSPSREIKDFNILMEWYKLNRSET